MLQRSVPISLAKKWDSLYKKGSTEIWIMSLYFSLFRLQVCGFDNIIICSNRKCHPVWLESPARHHYDEINSLTLFMSYYSSLPLFFVVYFANICLWSENEKLGGSTTTMATKTKKNKKEKKKKKATNCIRYSCVPLIINIIIISSSFIGQTKRVDLMQNRCAFTQ